MEENEKVEMIKIIIEYQVKYSKNYWNIVNVLVQYVSKNFIELI